jgi:hypothetical protein
MSLNWQNLEIEQLHSVCLIDQEMARNPSAVVQFQLPSCPESVRIIRVPNVLYDPRLRLQVLPSGGVPTEGINEWLLNFVRGRFPKDNFRTMNEPRFIDQEVCVLSKMGSRNFYHWTTEQLLKVIILENTGFTGIYALSDQPDFCYSFLECLGISPNRIFDMQNEPTVFNESVLMTPITCEDFPEKYPGLFFLLRETLLNSADRDLPTTPRKIWLDRVLQVNNVRQFINSDQVYKLIESYGFEIVDMATHDVRDQIAIANRAEVIMGMHGAAFTHAMFMKPRSMVIECFSPAFINSGYLEICSLLHHRYAMVVHRNAYGAYEYGNDLKVDCFQLELVLQSFNLGGE